MSYFYTGQSVYGPQEAVVAGAVVPGLDDVPGTASIYSGAGAPAFSAPSGSIYLSYSEGSVYVNTSPGGTSGTDWTPVGGGGLGVSSVTASSPLSSSGGSNPDISFTGVLSQANGGTGSTSLPVSSLNGLTSGAISITSTDSSVTITPSGSSVNLSASTAVYASNGTSLSNSHIVVGRGNTGTFTLSGSAAFTGASTYYVVANVNDTVGSTAFDLVVNQTSGSSFTITPATGGPYACSWIAVGY